MNLFFIGRTKYLLDSIKFLSSCGHKVCGIWTAPPSDYDVISAKDFEVESKKHDCFFYYGSKYEEELLKKIKALNCDAAISVNYPFIIKKGLTECFRYGIINAHAGDLPKYRGNAVINWAILNGEEKIGLSIHFMDPGELDSGPIIHKEFYNITNETYVTDIAQWLEIAIPRSFQQALESIKQNFFGEKQSNNASDILYCYPRRPEDARIDWNKPAAEIVKLIRASSRPFLGAFTTLEKEDKVIIWKAKLKKKNSNFLAIPGQIIDEKHIVCGDGELIELEEIETISKQKFSVRKRFI